MVTITDRFQFQATAIKWGEHKLDILHQKIVDWISKEFSVTAIDFMCEARETQKGLGQQIIHIILDRVDDVKQVQSNRANLKLIADYFLSHLTSGDRSPWEKDLLKSNVFPLGTTPFPEIVVTFRPLKIIEGKVQKDMREEALYEKLKMYPEVWSKSMNVVFFYTDAQLKENLANGTANKISGELVQINARYGFVSENDPQPFRFDSKEAFDRDYSSKWHYYWK